MVFSGSLIVSGSAIAEVTATGPASEIGRIGSSLAKLETETPHLQRQMRRLVIAFAALGALGQSGGRGALRASARRLAGRGACGHRGGHVDAARRIPDGPGRLHGDGGVADFEGQGSDTARLCHRDAGRGIGAVHRQDRHPDRKPHDDRRTAPGGRDDRADRRKRLARGVPRTGGSGRHGLCARTVRSDGKGLSCAGRRRLCATGHPCRARGEPWREPMR